MKICHRHNIVERKSERIIAGKRIEENIIAQQVKMTQEIRVFKF